MNNSTPQSSSAQPSATSSTAQPLTLPSGATLKNRFFKSAMHEALADRNAAPTEDHVQLYRRWAEGGAGALLTGNVMVDSKHLGEPGNVAVEDESHLPVLRRWAEAGTTNGTHLWMQINHPGKQSPRTINPHPVAPSETTLGGDYERFFASPRELSIDEIHDIQRRFITTARIAKKAGFTGVQIHSAHGYLVNQFLSPLDNQRTDEYGGALENRMRFLTEIYSGMREELGNDYPISVKLNSSDGVPGGFTEEESLQVAETLSQLGVDVIEISGGTYTKPTMTTNSNHEDQKRGVYFADYARKLADRVHTPVALTGGFRQAEDMERALESGITDLIGIARPLVIAPDLPNRIINEGYRERISTPRISTGVKKLDQAFGSILVISWYELQMRNIARGKQVATSGNGLPALAAALRRHGLSALMPRRAGGRN